MKLEEVSTKKPGMIARLKVTLLLAVMAVMGFAGTVSAETINWTDITEIITGMATSLIPAFVTLVLAAVPLLVILAVVGFVMQFLDRILDMLKMR
jgi:hypothetical protein